MVESLFSDSVWPSNNSGIYAIINRNNLKIYIGSAVCLAHRKRCHKYNISKGNHHSPYLQKAARKEPQAFEFSVIETIDDKSKLIEREQFWINFYKSYIPENGYNLRSNASSRLGTPFSRPFTVEHRRKISLGNMGRVSPMKGKTHSAETKLKMSLAHKGKQYTLGRVMPDDEKKRRSEMFKGRVFTPEWKERISKAKKGIPPKPHVIAASILARKKLRLKSKT